MSLVNDFRTTPGSTVRKLIKTIWFSNHKMVNIGGANPVGVLGIKEFLLFLLNLTFSNCLRSDNCNA